MSISDFMQKFSTEKKCREYLVNTRWKDGFVCPKCGSKRHCKLSNGLFQCIECHHQTSATAGTFMHRSHVSLVKWFLALYFITQDKRGISAIQLAFAIGVNYKTAWFMLKRIRAAMGQRNAKHTLSGVVEFDDAYIGGQTVGKKRGRGTEKAKVFVALSLDENGNPRFLKMGVTENLRQKSVKNFANRAIKPGSTVLSDECRSYIPALTDYNHQHSAYDPSSGMLKWLHVMIGNVKDFILGTYHGLPKKLLQSYLDEFCYRFSRRYFGSELFDRLLIAVVDQPLAESNG
jgi:ribosomal protein L37AE/L43A/transposase-like protein